MSSFRCISAEIAWPCPRDQITFTIIMIGPFQINHYRPRITTSRNVFDFHEATTLVGAFTGHEGLIIAEISIIRGSEDPTERS